MKQYFKYLGMTFGILGGTGLAVFLGNLLFGTGGAVAAAIAVVGLGIWYYQYDYNKNKCPNRD